MCAEVRRRSGSQARPSSARRAGRASSVSCDAGSMAAACELAASRSTSIAASTIASPIASSPPCAAPCF
jgi:hypothetical protein